MFDLCLFSCPTYFRFLPSESRAFRTRSSSSASSFPLPRSDRNDTKSFCAKIFSIRQKSKKVSKRLFPESITPLYFIKLGYFVKWVHPGLFLIHFCLFRTNITIIMGCVVAQLVERSPSSFSNKHYNFITN